LNKFYGILCLFFVLIFQTELKAFTNEDSLRIINYLESIINTDDFRHSENIEILNDVAQYIHQQFSIYSNEVSYQEYMAEGNVYKNVIASFGPLDAKRIIIGAHYDVCGDQDGADDNASGVVGLLELARKLPELSLKYRIDLVAYSLEEPPFFRTEFMGSYIHAKYLKDNNIDVLGMISLEMIGYYSNEKGSQDYPVGLLKWFYGDRGNFIALIKKFGAGTFANKFVSQFKKQNYIKTSTLTAPSWLSGIDFSDHLNYWHFGYSALMITDTAFYRNKNYHEKTDTIDTLDIKKMHQVIKTVIVSLNQISL